MTRILRIAVAALGAVVVVIVVAGLALPDTFELKTTLRSTKSPDEVLACVSAIENWGAIVAESDDDRFEVVGESETKANWYSASIDKTLPVTLTRHEDPARVELRYEGVAGPTVMGVTVEAGREGTVITRDLEMQASNPILGPLAYRIFVVPYREALEKNGDERLRRTCGL